MRATGEVTERLNVPVSKTGIRASVSWVRIPPSPPRPVPASPRTSRKIQFLRLASRFAYDLTSSIFMLRYMQDEKRRDKKEGRRRFGHAPVARDDEGAPGTRPPGDSEHRVARGMPVRLRDHGAASSQGSTAGQ